MSSREDRVIERELGNVKLCFSSNRDDLLVKSFEKVSEAVKESWRTSLKVTPVDALDPCYEIKSLRQPQVSALYSILSHLTGHERKDVTVVMPTGTGKTETMLASICGLPVDKALVVVPTDSLREQTFNKCISLGKLRELNAIHKETLNPVVALISGRLESNEELSFLLSANVIVTTPHSLNLSGPQIKKKLFQACSHLFVDEAHHVKAKIWRSVKEAFSGKDVVQFTATPFREDREKVGGKIIYNYPISLAQKNGYFRNITFKSVYEVSDIIGDEKVAETAVAQLREDLSNGYDHILMARCETKQRANDVGEIYKENYGDLNPVVIYSGMAGQKKKLKAVVEKEHRVVVCVNMLGEGFDLPELKVCALHDIHKSLPITLQFAGRFVRDRPDLGNPTFVANICDQKVEDTLKSLYEEDPDWNRSLQRISEASIKREVEFQELIENSVTTGNEVPLENIKPALSAIVYKVDSANLDVEISKVPLERGEKLVASIKISDPNILVLVTKIDISTKWAPLSELSQVEWRLVIAFHDEKEGLLFIHDSSKTGARSRLVKCLAKNPDLLKGDHVFKSFGNIERLVLQNAGLNKGRRGPLRYVMYTGIDIETAINDLAQGGSYKSNLFGKGFESGSKVSIGCSYKGRVWSMSSAPVIDWIDWCREIGSKLNDDLIDPNAILDKVMRTREVSHVPDLVPICLDWPDYLFEYGFSSVSLEVMGRSYNLEDACFSIFEFQSGKIDFDVSVGGFSEKYSYTISQNGYQVKRLSGDFLYLNNKDGKRLLEEFFDNEESPSVFFEDGSKLFENLHIVRPDNFTIPHYRVGLLKQWSWGVNVRRESQGEEKNKDTIQYAVISKIVQQHESWIVFDDDGANEVADIVSFRNEGEVLVIEFFHLKYSHGASPGSRIIDFYEVCGQVVKCCKWVGEFDKLIDQLKKRERSRVNASKSSRLEKGEFRDFELLRQHGGRLRKEYKFYVVQPGLDTKNVSADVLSLLGSIDLYVKETTGHNMVVIGS
ncbi:DEAD/DEAH box helicase [Salinicola endophyticus]|uniref:DEAD/DEAH box helicase n=1 Tax=Salinicola endophyticus TaxID=1949083 RepID=UPI000DA14B32|nr:DEAD/DEAH box helicase family protein [Salinicola endophyticus]